MKNAVLMILMVVAFSSVAYAKPSFDCAKASTSVEHAICSDTRLGNLDGLLSQNYKGLFTADVDADGSKMLKAEQKEWMAKRNACTTNQCIEEAYKSRIDDVCDKPVASGVNDCQGWSTLDGPNEFLATAPAPAPVVQQSTQDPFQVSIGKKLLYGDRYYNVIEVLPINDPVVITNVLVNKNPTCTDKTALSYQLGKTYHMGEKMTFGFGQCTPVQVDITTNVGSFTYRFN